MKVKIIAHGKERDKNRLALQEEYFKRCRGWKIEVIETDELESKIPKGAFVIVLDERGKDLKTSELSEKIEKAGREIVFVIGAADGHTDTMRKRADLLLAFGKLTWAHMLIRVMLSEQIYRVWSLQNNHPISPGIIAYSP